MLRFEFSVLFLLATCAIGSFSVKLEQKFRWKDVTFAWPSESAKEEAVTSGRYKAENNLPLGLDIWNDKLFITVPRYDAFKYSKKIM